MFYEIRERNRWVFLQTHLVGLSYNLLCIFLWNPLLFSRFLLLKLLLQIRDYVIWLLRDYFFWNLIYNWKIQKALLVCLNILLYPWLAILKQIFKVTCDNRFEILINMHEILIPDGWIQNIKQFHLCYFFNWLVFSIDDFILKFLVKLISDL